MFVPLFFRLHIFVKSYYICPPLSYLLSVSLRILPSRSIQVASKISFFFMVNILLHIPTMSSLFIYQWTLRLLLHLGHCTQCCNEPRGAHIFLKQCFSSKKRAWSGIALPHGSSIFNFLRKLHIAFHSGYTNLLSHQQYANSPFSPHPHQDLFFAVFGW